MSKSIETEEKLTKFMNEMISRIFPESTMPNYRYWRITLKQLEKHVRKSANRKRRMHKKDSKAFAYTTEPIIKDGKRKYYALTYKIKEYPGNRERWILTKKVEFAKRKIAKSRAYKWYSKRHSRLLALGKL